MKNSRHRPRRMTDLEPSTYSRVAQSDRLFADRMERARLGARGGLYGGIGVAAAFAFLFREGAHSLIYWCWLGTIAVHFVVRARQLLVPLPEDPQAVRRWARRSRVGLVLAGTLWGMSAMVFFPFAGAGGLYLLTATQYVIAIMSVAAFSWYPPAFIAFITPLFVLMGVPWFLSGSQFAWTIQLLILCTYAVLIDYVNRNAKVLVAGLALRYEREELLAQLVARTEEAERANISKTRFLASASHDLRQPLHALGLLSAHAMVVSRDLTLRPVLEQIQSSTRILGNLIHSLLDVSRLDAGVVTPSRQYFPVQQVIDGVVEESVVVAESKGLVLRVRRTAHWTDSDPVMLASIIRNLLTNAIRYTTEGGVLVASRVRGQQLSIEVWDTGIGIAGDKLDHVFEEFVQINNAARDRAQGVGLGLAIVARLAALLEHKIQVRSRLGRGSVFTLTVPKASGIGERAGSSTVTAPRDHLSGLRVLLIDDDADVSDATRKLLGGWGCESILAVDLASAIGAAQTNAFALDVVMTDYRLPGASGIAAANSIRALAHKNLPVILITGEIAATLNLSELAPPHAVLTKPVAAISLRAALAQLTRPAAPSQ